MVRERLKRRRRIHSAIVAIWLGSLIAAIAPCYWLLSDPAYAAHQPWLGISATCTIWGLITLVMRIFEKPVAEEIRKLERELYQ